MIVSHKHKFIFVKTHKTATQTFLKFIKQHLGPDDVMAGDPGNETNADTKVNIDKKFPATGKCAEDYQQVYGNHLPWFMIKEIVGDDIWSEYTKITIERDPYDRILSLFYMMNFQITSNNMLPNPDTQKKLWDELLVKEKNKEITVEQSIQTRKDWLEQLQTNSIMSEHPDETREYFEEWCLAQLETAPLNLTEHKTYGSDCWQTERNAVKQTIDNFKFTRLKQMITGDATWTNNAGQKFFAFPYVKNNNTFGINQQYFTEMNHFLGQCRFLNYGNYFDGNNIQVDHVIDFNNVGDNIGKCFNKHGINIQCNKNLYDQATQNAHYRKNLKGKPSNNWWYNGPRGEWLHKVIKRRFYNEHMNKNQINFNKIITG